MDDIEGFIKKLCDEFSAVDRLLSSIMKEEKELADSVLVKKGFLIRKYSINYPQLKPDVFDNIIKELNRLREIESFLMEELFEKRTLLERLEREYRNNFGKELHADALEPQLKEAFNYTCLLIPCAEEFRAILEQDIALHKKSLDETMVSFLTLFEHRANKIMIFTRYLEKIFKQSLSLEKYFYESPRSYGRAMADKEYDDTMKSRRLCSTKNPTPVFDAPEKLISRVMAMSKDERKDLFSQIGVKGGFRIVFFQTNLKPINHEHPITQSNGLREYKFPKNLDIEILRAA